MTKIQIASKADTHPWAEHAYAIYSEQHLIGVVNVFGGNESLGFKPYDARKKQLCDCMISLDDAVAEIVCAAGV